MIAFTKPELFLLYFNYIYVVSLTFYDVLDFTVHKIIFNSVIFFLQSIATSLWKFILCAFKAFQAYMKVLVFKLIQALF